MSKDKPNEGPPTQQFNVKDLAEMKKNLTPQERASFENTRRIPTTEIPGDEVDRVRDSQGGIIGKMMGWLNLGKPKEGEPGLSKPTDLKEQSGLTSTRIEAQRTAASRLERLKIKNSFILALYNAVDFKKSAILTRKIIRELPFLREETGETKDGMNIVLIELVDEKGEFVGNLKCYMEREAIKGWKFVDSIAEDAPSA